MNVEMRSRLSRGDRMEQTLGVAHELFAERGYAEVTMDEIAAAADPATNSATRATSAMAPRIRAPILSSRPTHLMPLLLPDGRDM